MKKYIAVLLLAQILSSAVCRHSADWSVKGCSAVRFVDSVKYKGKQYYLLLASYGSRTDVWAASSPGKIDPQKDVLLLSVSVLKTTIQEAQEIACSVVDDIGDAKTIVGCAPLVTQGFALVEGAYGFVKEGTPILATDINWEYFTGEGWGDCIMGFLGDLADDIGIGSDWAANETNMAIGRNDVKAALEGALGLVCSRVEGKGPPGSVAHPLGTVFGVAPPVVGNNAPGNGQANGQAKPATGPTQVNGHSPDGHDGHDPVTPANGNPGGGQGGAPAIPGKPTEGVPPNNWPGNNIPINIPIIPSDPFQDHNPQGTVLTSNDPDDTKDDNVGTGDRDNDDDREGGEHDEAFVLHGNFIPSTLQTIKNLVVTIAQAAQKTKSIPASVFVRRNTARLIAKGYLVKKYGAAAIAAEAPYEQNYIRGYWVINGSTPPCSKKKAFMVIIDASTGGIVKVIPP